MAFNPQLFGAGQRGRSVALTAQRRVNAFMDVVREPGKQDRAQISFWCRPGLGAGFGTGVGGGAAYYGAQPARGAHVVPPYLYVVYGNQLYRIASDGTQTPLGGALLSNNGPVYMVDNGVQLGFCDALGNWYVYQIFGVSAATGLVAGNVQTFTPGALGFLGARHATYLDNVALVAVPGSNPLSSQQMQQGNLGDFTGWNALAFDLADSAPDPLVAVKGWKGVLYAFGSLSTEIWQNIGGAIFQFGRTPTNVAAVGLAAVNSIAEFGDMGLCLLGQTAGGQVVPTLLAGGGYPPDGQNPLADADMVATINAKNPNGTLVYGTLADAVGRSFMWDNHRFYLLTFPTAGKAWLWDSTTGAWSELTSDTGVAVNGPALGTPTGVQGQFRGALCLVYEGRLLFFDYADGHVYLARGTGEQDTDNGCPFPFQLVSRHVFEANKMLGLPRLQLDWEEGVGNLAGDGTDPLAQLEVSRDKGRTWSLPMTAAIGAFGKNTARCIFRRCGSARDLTLRVTCSAPVKRVLTGEVPEFELYDT